MKNPQRLLCSRLLDVIENDIIPKTVTGVSRGNKIFGAAIMKKSDLSLVIAGTNDEINNPLNHGEISTLNEFFSIPADDRPSPEDCIFVSTHEPCSLCLSAITWANFDNFYYFFGYEDTRDSFNIPHDLNILKEVFNIQDGQYARKNKFWECTHLLSLVEKLSNGDNNRLNLQVERLKKRYSELSTIYQNQKEESGIPLN
ncbi:MAG: nucleoside deaminase [Pseudomonadota bacterium]|nr:nucleoside deaminase [Pseudomonadota bacterium]